MNKKAVVLLSGGLDSATTLAIANAQEYICFALTFNYGQRHSIEIEAAKKIAQSFNVTEHKILDVDLTQIGGSALTDQKINVPDAPSDGIPDTYVPARNTIFLSFALAYAETIQAYEIYLGVNSIDYSGYPDCRPEYIKSFTQTANLATKASVEGQNFIIQTPLMYMNKPQIIQAGLELGVDYSLTISCYQPDMNGLACGICDSCRLRKIGFEQGGIPDPTLYL
jgi:7-cyano-7-deazaguanine synthase